MRQRPSLQSRQWWPGGPLAQLKSTLLIAKLKAKQCELLACTVLPSCHSLSPSALHLKSPNAPVLDSLQLLAQALALQPNVKLPNSANKNK